MLDNPAVRVGNNENRQRRRQREKHAQVSMFAQRPERFIRSVRRRT